MRGFRELGDARGGGAAEEWQHWRVADSRHVHVAGVLRVDWEVPEGWEWIPA